MHPNNRKRPNTPTPKHKPHKLTFFRHNHRHFSTDLGNEFCRALQNRGWKAARNSKSAHVVWSNQGNSGAKCYPDQWTNHFGGNASITTKGGLAAQFTSCHVWSSDMDPERLMPRSYVLSNKERIHEFRIDFVDTTIAGILSRVVCGDVPRDPKRLSLLRTAVKACEQRWIDADDDCDGSTYERKRKENANTVNDGDKNNFVARSDGDGNIVDDSEEEQRQQQQQQQQHDTEENCEAIAESGHTYINRNHDKRSECMGRDNKKCVEGEKHNRSHDMISPAGMLSEDVQERLLAWSNELSDTQQATSATRFQGAANVRATETATTKLTSLKTQEFERGARLATREAVLGGRSRKEKEKREKGKKGKRNNNTIRNNNNNSSSNNNSSNNNSNMPFPTNKQQVVRTGCWGALELRCKRIIEKWKANDIQFEMGGDKCIWVIKAAAASKGVGISLHKSFEDIVRVASGNTARVVQKYIERPFLCNGFKFDIRVWVVVTSWEPCEIWISRWMYGRVCSQRFTTDTHDLNNRAVHLSNCHVPTNSLELSKCNNNNNSNSNNTETVEIRRLAKRPQANFRNHGDGKVSHIQSNRIAEQQDHRDTVEDSRVESNFQTFKSLNRSHITDRAQQQQEQQQQFYSNNNNEGNLPSLLADEELREYIVSRFGHTAARNVDKRIRECVGQTIKGGRDRVQQRPRTFELYGVDIVLDESLHPWTLEVNLSPGVSHCAHQFPDIVEQLANDVVDLMLLNPTPDTSTGKIVEQPRCTTIGMFDLFHANEPSHIINSRHSVNYSDMLSTKTSTTRLSKSKLKRLRVNAQALYPARIKIEQIDHWCATREAPATLRSFVVYCCRVWPIFKIRRSKARHVIVHWWRSICFRRIIRTRYTVRWYNGVSEQLVSRNMVTSVRMFLGCVVMLRKQNQRKITTTWLKWQRVHTITAASKLITQNIRVYHISQQKQRKTKAIAACKRGIRFAVLKTTTRSFILRKMLKIWKLHITVMNHKQCRELAVTIACVKQNMRRHMGEKAIKKWTDVRRNRHHMRQLMGCWKNVVQYKIRRRQDIYFAAVRIQRMARAMLARSRKRTLVRRRNALYAVMAIGGLNDVHNEYMFEQRLERNFESSREQPPRESKQRPRRVRAKGKTKRRPRSRVRRKYRASS